MVTEAINHDPAITFAQTAPSWRAGRAGRVALLRARVHERGPADLHGHDLQERRGSRSTIGCGQRFPPTHHQGQAPSGADPVLYLADAPGIDRARRRRMLDDLARLNGARADADAETEARTRQYELACMQAAVPDLVDIPNEPASVLERYGPKVHEPGSFARNCLLARRMIERDVRFVQLYHMGWDHHANLPKEITTCVRTPTSPPPRWFDLEDGAPR